MFTETRSSGARGDKKTPGSQKSKLKANMESKPGQFICSAFLLITWVHWFEKSMIIVERSKWHYYPK